MLRIVRGLLSLFLAFLFLNPLGIKGNRFIHSNLQSRSFFSGENPQLIEILKRLELNHKNGEKPDFSEILDAVKYGLKDNPYKISAMDEFVSNRDRNARKFSTDANAVWRAMAGNILKGETSKAISHYRNYLWLKRNAEIAEIEEFPLSIRYIYSELLFNSDIKNTPTITYEDLEFLVTELIRKLKNLGDVWPLEGDFEYQGENISGDLSRNKIFKFIMDGIINNKEKPFFWGTEQVQIDRIQRLRSLVFCHFIRIEKIEGFNEFHHEPRGMDFSFANLQEARLDFWWVSNETRNFRGINLRKGRISGTYYHDDFENADLRGAVVTARFHEANLSGANLSYATCKLVDFRSANLNDANLKYAKLYKVNLSRTLHPAYIDSYQGLNRANFSNTELKEANLKYANAKNANFTNADLREANLEGFEYFRDRLEVNYLGFQNADFTNANLQKANLKYANARNANFENANLQRANLENADLRGANFENANLKWAKTKNARIYRSQSKYFSKKLIKNIIIEEDPIEPAIIFETAL